MGRLYIQQSKHTGRTCSNCLSRDECQGMLYGPKKGYLCLEWMMSSGEVVIWNESTVPQRPVEAEC